MRYPTQEPLGIPPAWESYLTGRVEAEPTGPSWVREQLTLYGILPAEKARPATRRRGRTLPESPPPTPQGTPPPPMAPARHPSTLLVKRFVMAPSTSNGNASGWT